MEEESSILKGHSEEFAFKNVERMIIKPDIP